MGDTARTPYRAAVRRGRAPCPCRHRSRCRRWCYNDKRDPHRPLPSLPRWRGSGQACLPSYSSPPATRLSVINQNVEDEMFIEALNLWELEGGLEQGMQHVEAGFIGGEPVRSIFIPPKRRTLTLPSGRRLHGHPHCSSWVISVGQ